ncbi:MAG: tetratricopeptide repeat protein [Flavobacteriales bacterium]|nr:tetratricopeptide repeat protein [Flavobacteriales bacterium]MCB9336199.1 tetratricopeptide repeat protein [Flavobacteriales bacterium]
MKKGISFILLCFSVLVLNATTWRDSLNTIVNSNQHDTVKILALEQLAANYRKNEPDSALFFNQKAIDLSKKTKIAKEIAEAYREYALSAQAIGKYPLAVEYYQKAQKVHLKDNNKNGVAEAFNDIGIAFYYSGEYEKARENFEKAGEIKIEIGDSIGAGQSFNNTGIMHDIAGNPTEALKLYLRALNIYENLRDTGMAIGTLSNIGLIYLGQKNYTEALKIYERQKEDAKNIGDRKQYGISLTSMGTAYDYLGEYIKARKLFLEALDLFLQLGDKPLIAQCYNNLSANFELTDDNDKALEYALKSISIKKEIGAHGKLAISQIAAAKIYNKKGKNHQALALYQDALKNAQNTGYAEYIIKAHEGLSQTYESLKSFEKAYYHQSQYIALADSVTNKENTELINEMEKKYQNERKQQEIELLNKTNALKDVKLAKADEESKRKSIQLYGSFGVGLILLVLVLVVFKSSQQRKKNNILLQQKNTEITQQKEIVEEQHKEITDSINYAKRIQTALLTSDEYWHQISPEHFVLLKPKDVVSGDFFWAFHTENNLAIWVAADCTGHGVPGAFMSMLGISFFNEIVVENNITQPAEILNRLRDKIIKALEQKGVDTQQKDGMDLALCVWNKNTNQLSYSGANNPLWIIRKTDKTNQDSDNLIIEGYELIEHKADKQPVGLFSGDIKPFTEQIIQLQKGDSIYTFSDGYADQFGGDKGKKLKSANFKKLLLTLQDKSLAEQKNIINQTFDEWKGNLDQIDDVCVIGVKI